MKLYFCWKFNNKVSFMIFFIIRNICKSSYNFDSFSIFYIKPLVSFHSSGMSDKFIIFILLNEFIEFLLGSVSIHDNVLFLVIEFMIYGNESMHFFVLIFDFKWEIVDLMMKLLIFLFLLFQKWLKFIFFLETFWLCSFEFEGMLLLLNLFLEKISKFFF